MADGTQRPTPPARSSDVLILEERSGTRQMVLRKLLLHTPLALAFGGVTFVALYYAFTNSMGALVGAAIFGLPAGAFGYEALTAARDLRSKPITTRGRIARMWNKGTVLWMTRAYYLLVDLPGRDEGQRFFVVSHAAYLQLDEGRTVEVEHWPHTHTVVSLGVVESARAARSSRPN
jgi:hypothetical protein